MKKMVHILYSGLGGHGAVLFTLLEHRFMESAQHVVVFVGVEEPRAEYVARCGELNIPWIYVPRNPAISYLGFVLAMFRQLRFIDPNMIFAHGLAATPSLALLRCLSWKKRFIVLRETQAHHLKSFQEWVFLIVANVMFDRIVCLTKEAQIGARAKLGFFHSPRKSVVIGNGLDTDYFRSDKKITSPEKIKIGMQSRLQSNKDHRTLINAFDILRTGNAKLNISLHIAGEGDTMNSLKEYVELLGLSDRVLFHGMLGQDALREFLNDLTVYVHCTHGETMSTAIMQALSMGLPVIASDVWGVSNMINSGNGLLYRPGDSSDLAGKLQLLIDDRGLVKTLGACARRDAQDNYNNAELVARYSEVLSAEM